MKLLVNKLRTLDAAGEAYALRLLLPGGVWVTVLLIEYDHESMLATLCDYRKQEVMCILWQNVEIATIKLFEPEVPDGQI